MVNTGGIAVARALLDRQKAAAKHGCSAEERCNGSAGGDDALRGRGGVRQPALEVH